MERTIRKTEGEYPQKIFAHQLITIDDLQQFKKQLLDELLFGFKKASRCGSKKMVEVTRAKKAS